MSRFRWIWETEVNNEQIGKNGARIVTSLGIRLTGCTVQTDMCLTTLPQWLSNLDSPVIQLNTEGIHGWHVSTFLYFQKAVWFLFIVFVYYFWNKFHRTTDMLVYWWSQNGRLSAHCCFYAVPHYTRHTSAVFVISFHCFALDIATIGSKNINREHIHDAVSHNFLVS